MDESHDLVAQLNGLVRVVWDAKPDQQIRPAHHSQADLAVPLRHLLYLRQGIAVHVDDVVEKVDGRPGGFAQAIPVHNAVFDHELQVERAQVAAFIGQQGLFAARIGGLDLPEFGRRVVSIEPVEEDDPGLAVLPREIDDEVEHLAGVLAPDFFPASGGCAARIRRPMSTAAMNSSVTPTEMLKLFRMCSSSLALMNSIMSGWSTRRMPILAPRRVPPCLMVSVAVSKTRMKETGPLATPMVDRPGRSWAVGD